MTGINGSMPKCLWKQKVFKIKIILLSELSERRDNSGKTSITIFTSNVEPLQVISPRQNMGQCQFLRTEVLVPKCFNRE